MTDLVPFYAIVSIFIAAAGCFAMVTGWVGSIVEKNHKASWAIAGACGTSVALFFGFLAATLLAIVHPA